MRKPLSLLLSVFLLVIPAIAQKPKRAAPRPARAVVIEPSIAVVRDSPGFAGRTLKRLRRGRDLPVIGSRSADGATFLRVMISARTSGWIQRDAVIMRGVAGEEDRLLRLIPLLKGFDQIEATRLFLNEFQSSAQRPAMLVLFGDLVEEASVKLSAQARRKLDRRLASAVGGPLEGFLLDFAGLERYRKLGIVFAANSRTMRIHYAGTAWRETVNRYPDSPHAAEARLRLAEFEARMNATGN